MAARQRRMHGCEGVGALASMPLDGGGIARVECFDSKVHIEGARCTLYRPTLAGGAQPPQPSLALALAPEPAPLAAPPSDSPRVAFEHDGVTTRVQVAFREPVSLYGGGLAFAPLLRNGRAIELWNTDAFRHGEATPALYQSHPYALAVLPSGRAVGILADSVRRGGITFAADGVELAFEEEPFDLYLIEAASPQLAQRALAQRIGYPAAVPAWALGYHQCRWGYETADEVLRVAREMRERKIPCDALWLDIDHMHRHRTLTFDPERFADPRKLVAELRALDLATVAIVDPGVAVAQGCELYEAGLAGEHFVLDARGAPVRGRVWPGVCTFPDFTREATREWWAREVERFAAVGLAGLWCDMNEPSVFRTPSRTLPLDARHRGLGGGTHARFHNLYGQLMAEATRAGLARALGNRTPFVLTRASHVGGARFAATWTGDNQATWEDLRAAIPMVLSLGLCGQPFAGPDLGGFDGDPTPELFARWFDLGAWLPFARGHSERTACRKEPWAFGAEVERCVRSALERRMRLAPLWLDLARDSARTGLPIVRPLFFADPVDPALRAVDDQFLLGDDLLVAPVLAEGARERELFLPRTPGGGWYAFPDGRELIPPGFVRASAALGETPVFARAGSLVVVSAGGESVRAALAAPRTVHVFAELDRGRDKTLERAAAARATAEKARIVWHRPRG